MSRIEVLLVDDHTVVLQTLARALAAAPDIEVVGTARTAADACSMAETLQPDVALVDVTLPDGNGIAVARSIQHASGSTRVLMLTGNTDVSLLAK
ncbi:MAG TPA: response regulator transcription factor, partial [Actinomycetota bacterium]